LFDKPKPTVGCSASGRRRRIICVSCMTDKFYEVTWTYKSLVLQRYVTDATDSYKILY
jgi:hypothetical protein